MHEPTAQWTRHVALGAAATLATFAFTHDTLAERPRGVVSQSAPVCQVKGEARQLPGDLAEASGLIPAAKGDVFWMHNDGNTSELIAVDKSGKLLGRVSLGNSAITDLETIDSGPCDDGTCIYLGDVGDNNASRSEIVVYRLREPTGTSGAAAHITSIRARYPDGPRDAEALIATRDGGLYVISKGDGGPVALYRFPENAASGEVVTLARVRTLKDGKTAKADWVTDADMSPNGAWVAVRTLGYIDFYRTSDFTGNGKAVHRMDLSALKEAQGEGIAFGANSRAVFVSSEGGGKGKAGSFAELECRLD